MAVSKDVKKTLWGRVYYSTLGVAVSIDTATTDSTVRIHVGRNAYMAGLGVKAFIKIVKILKKYEEMGWSGLPPTLKQIIEEYN